LKKLAFLGGAAGLGFIALLHSPITQAADHLDVTALATNPMADINDVYVWLTGGGAKLNLALTVSPFDDGTRNFGPTVQYVFHVRRYPPFNGGAGFPTTVEKILAGEESKVICTFASNTDGKCWVVDPAGKTVDYVAGDLSAATGKASVGGKLRVFAGRRSDPFFFNLAGFLTAQKKIEYACGTANPAVPTIGACPGVLKTAGFTDAAGCPYMLPAANVEAIAADLSEQQTGPSTADPLSTLGPCPSTAKDCFAGKNVMAIVVEMDKTLIASDAFPLLSVWGSTHAGQ
jgi:hypothetical protein